MILSGRMWKCRTEVETKGSKAVFYDEYGEEYDIEKVVNCLIDGATFGEIRKMEVAQKEVNNAT